MKKSRVPSSGQRPADRAVAHPVFSRSDKLRDQIDARGLTCVDTAWLGWNTKHRFTCTLGHPLETTPTNLLHGGGACRMCRDSALLLQLQRLAADADATCLDTTWRGHKATYRFRCSQGHEWERNAKHRPGCPVCIKSAANARRRLSNGLQRLTQAAREHGGDCLSSTYLGQAKPHLFRCAAGHEWRSTEVLRGAWCGTCAIAEKGAKRRLADGLERLQQAANAKGGMCLSATYEGHRKPHRFRCAKGHEWETLATRILRGAWCLPCGHEQRRGRRPNPERLARLQEEAEKRGGKCLSDAYLGGDRHHRFRCVHGHEWEALAMSILQGKWCSECRYDKRRLGIDVARAMARERGGECLSETYPLSNQKMIWMCHRGHTWQALFAKIRVGQWCPQCAHLARITTGGAAARKKYEAVGRQV